MVLLFVLVSSLLSGRTLHLLCDRLVFEFEVAARFNGGGGAFLLPLPPLIFPGLISLCRVFGGKGNGIGGGGLLEVKIVGLKKSLLLRIVIDEL